MEPVSREVGKVAIPATVNTPPMTFMHNGRQFVVLSVAERGIEAEQVALALPN